MLVEHDHPHGSAALEIALSRSDESGARRIALVVNAQTALADVDIRRLGFCCDDAAAVMVYSDFYERSASDTLQMMPLIAYQPGSIRDAFNFGSLVCLDREAVTAARAAIRDNGATPRR